ncbi:hypothetical protein COV88_03660 [Candidatus Saccharibacteria bacterium CG11_big_fil_rev_8_21_14_0_20_41_19]|nr:MAG: hypothetical protein COV88_03660 [Candidatus Saccharibacteria bacterium CG11_big_fil_rev_8_21_14_0_20_41_19]
MEFIQLTQLVQTMEMVYQLVRAQHMVTTLRHQQAFVLRPLRTQLTIELLIIASQGWAFVRVQDETDSR